ncbi:MAG: hypothetical protein UT14_C0033G0018 [Candidatus Shapirobacteria bacterium GW2011_GWE1_38_92]|uniref:Uncharacterized protein n=1 Tax=Candidatus Shapirobacteria bacterium GW2011_GWE1_38_92 TaxID=1618489 RepID=A0A0G0LFK5_9BACT|nr:MAG: hypothetical protein UT14_C0033G0018 [Candidatus Shapirobacteria bacterium GW2011_GWE1_38_92]
MLTAAVPLLRFRRAVGVEAPIPTLPLARMVRRSTPAVEKPTTSVVRRNIPLFVSVSQEKDGRRAVSAAFPKKAAVVMEMSAPTLRVVPT